MSSMQHIQKLSFSQRNMHVTKALLLNDPGNLYLGSNATKVHVICLSDNWCS